jgi:hypothetical protein
MAAMNSADAGGQSRRRKTKRTPVDIPASARERKAYFWEEPPRAKVLEIVRFVHETGKAHMHPDVTYTTISRDTEIRFLEVFSLAEKFKHDTGNWCVCAACQHDLPQFKDNGIVAWVPDEGIIVIIGGDCYKTLNPEGHERAMRLYEVDTARRKDETYLLRALRVVPILLSDIQSDLVIARAFEQVRREVIDALQKYGIDLAYHAKGGKLKIEQRVKQRIHGSSSSRTVTHRNVYAAIKGHSFLDPRLEKFSARFQALIGPLKAIDFEPPIQERVLSMTDSERRLAADTLRESIKELTALRRELDDARKFIRHETLATLRTWSDLPNATLQFFLEFDKAELRIGMSPLRNDVVRIPLEVYDELAPPPTMAPEKVN